MKPLEFNFNEDPVPQEATRPENVYINGSWNNMSRQEMNALTREQLMADPTYVAATLQWAERRGRDRLIGQAFRVGLILVMLLWMGSVAADNWANLGPVELAIGTLLMLAWAVPAIYAAVRID